MIEKYLCQRASSQPMEKASTLLEDRKKKLEILKSMGVNLYPTGFECDLTAAEALERFGDLDTESLQKSDQAFSIAGRIVAVRDFGKASFIHIKDRSGRIQAYIRKDKVGESDSRSSSSWTSAISSASGAVFSRPGQVNSPSWPRTSGFFQRPSGPAREVARVDGR
jgi:lysyl-tRNA synthetase class II